MKQIKKILKVASNRIFIIILVLLLQFGWLIWGTWFLTDKNPYIQGGLRAIGLLTVLWLVNKRINPAYKLIWTIIILVFPFFGITMYFVMGKSRIARKMQREFDRVFENRKDYMRENERIRKRLEMIAPSAAGQSRYIRESSGYPLYQQTITEYYSVGEDWFQKYVQELEKAEHFIFLEYFIIARGYMWNTVLELLEKKAAEGVDVRIIYDDIGCITTLPHHFYKELQAKKIKCAAFNPFRPLLNIVLNNRDHRKITIIDGHTAFTGGLNLADEYINQKDRFGHWKDAGVFLHGDAVWSFTLMFLQMWSGITGISENFDDYRPDKYQTMSYLSNGFVQPYSDTPLDDETVGENVYLNIISQARKYVYIFTPYLIIDNEIMTALCLAAKRGVDVRIVTPGVPDKKMVFLLTQSYYQPLLEAGVRIYEYAPGFLHSKNFVADDEIAVVGTINLDYRSLYLHFECATWMYGTGAIDQIKRDFTETLESCNEISLEFCKNRNILIRGVQSILRLFAPMM